MPSENLSQKEIVSKCLCKEMMGLQGCVIARKFLKEGARDIALPGALEIQFPN